MKSGDIIVHLNKGRSLPAWGAWIEILADIGLEAIE